MKADKTPALREERGINQLATQTDVQLRRDFAAMGRSVVLQRAGQRTATELGLGTHGLRSEDVR